MLIRSFEDIVAWQKAKGLNIALHLAFKDCKSYGFKDQLERAGVSVMNNIAEGYERGSNKEFRQFLYISKGSCGEVRSMLTLAVAYNYISEEKGHELAVMSIEISRMLSAFIKALSK